MSTTVSFTLGGMAFEYDEHKNQKNIKKHGIDFRSAARVFFDYDRIEYVDDVHSENEIRYDTIGDIAILQRSDDQTIIGSSDPWSNHILFVVYTERFCRCEDGEQTDVTRIISARFATNFERGLYYGKF